MDFPPFRPHPLLRGGHRQTIAGVYLAGGRFSYAANQHFVLLDDGDKIVLHDDQPPAWQPGDRVVLLVHGLGGCHGSPYMCRIAYKLGQRGIRVFRMDLRGWGAGAQCATLPFHAARTGDIEAALRLIQTAVPNSEVLLVGFSLGANMVLKLLGQRGVRLQACANQAEQMTSHRSGSSLAGLETYPTACPTRALAIAPPIDLMHCCVNLDRGLGRVYDRAYAKFLWNHLRERAGIVPAFAQALAQRRPRKIYDFDQRFTAPMGGFDSVEHYYETASAKHVLAQIRTPTIILTAIDDPIVPGYVFDSAKLSPSVQLHLTDHGGHLGYIAARNGDPDRRWLDWRIVDWVTA
jgi:predicted alpha/beta-fold hydrolase